MKKEYINLNKITEKLAEQYSEFEFESMEELWNNYNKDKVENEYSLIKMIKNLFIICGKENIDLNKYFPTYIESEE